MELSLGLLAFVFVLLRCFACSRLSLRVICVFTSQIYQFLKRERERNNKLGVDLARLRFFTLKRWRSWSLLLFRLKPFLKSHLHAYISISHFSAWRQEVKRKRRSTLLTRLDLAACTFFFADDLSFTLDDGASNDIPGAFSRWVSAIFWPVYEKTKRQKKIDVGLFFDDLDLMTLLS